MAEATYLGGKSIVSCLPGVFAALLQAQASINLQLPDLNAKISGAIAATANISITPPSLDLSAALAAALQFPGISVDISAMASLAAELNLTLGQLNIALGLILQLIGLGTAGVHLYMVEGDVGGMGAALQQEMGGGPPGQNPQDEGIGFLMVASADPTAVAALKTLFAV